MSHLLIVDDEQSICWGLTKLAGKIGCTSEAFSSAEQGLHAAAARAPDLILLDVRLPGMDGLTALEKFRERLPAVPVIVMTAYGELETAVEAIRRGAFEYLVKPFNLALAEQTIARGLAARSAVTTDDVPPAHDASAVDTGAPRIIGRSAAIQTVFKQIALCAPTDACIHLWGESGTGKELVARAIHHYSRRSTGPLVPVNLASLSPSLAESELFGHVRGAFTGAEQPRRGLLEQADGGTVFLDEVAEIPLSLQVKLLRVLEHKEIWPVGADRPRHSNFRLISATHQDLREKIADGSFRHDLYFRLISFQIDLPPLRERREDIAELAHEFLRSLAAKNGSGRPTLSAETLAELEQRAWYGNVRELQNVLEHALILARGGTIDPHHLPAPVPGGLPDNRSEISAVPALLRAWATAQAAQGQEVVDLYTRFLALVEPPLLTAVLDSHAGQLTSAARCLGLHRTTLKKKFDQYGLGGNAETSEGLTGCS